MGAKTAGYITGNTGFAINDSAFMNLAVSYGRDNRGRVYQQAIEPGIELSFPDRFNDIPQDEKLRAAIQWLKLHRKK